MKFNKVMLNYVKEIEKYISNNKERINTAKNFLNDEIIKGYIEKIYKACSPKEGYLCVLLTMLENFIPDERTQKFLIEIFKDATDLKIQNYRNYLKFKGYNEYEKEKDYNRTNISTLLFEDIRANGANHAIVKYEKIIKEIADLNLIDISRISTKIIEFYKASVLGDTQLKSKKSAEIKEYIKVYNSKIKEKYAADYEEKRIDEIKKYFEHTVDVLSDEANIDSVINEYISSLRNEITLKIKNVFGKYIEGEDLVEFFKNFRKNEAENFNMLGVDRPSAIDEYEKLKSHNRLVGSYLNKINEYFNKDNFNVFISVLNENKNLNQQLTKAQQLLINEIRPILKESESQFKFDEETNKIILITNIQPISKNEKENINIYIEKIRQYEKIKSQFFLYMKKNSYFVKATREDPNHFIDGIYHLNSNYDYLKNLDFIASVIDSVSDGLDNYEMYENVKNFLNQIIPCYLVMSDEKDVEFLSNFLKNINKFNNKETFSISKLSNIYKLVLLYRYVNPLALNILGEEVCKKLVFNSQFIDKKNDDEIIKQRIEKAVFVCNEAYNITRSSIPYFKDIKYGNITLQRYNNVDSRTLTSGIDTNSCIKLDGNDNDYLIYSILSSNGLIIRILEDDKFVGRITGHLFYNMLIINGIRNVKNDYKSTSIEESKRNKNIILAVEKLADELIELTKNSSCPIDFVCTNMAGILESHMYWEDKPKIEIGLINPIDTYGDDFEKFKKIFKNHPEYLSQVNVNEKETNYGKAPFTTDFGFHYPFVLIKAREGKYLEKLRDISINSQPPIYERPPFVSIVGSGYLSEEEINQCNRITSLRIYRREGLYGDVVRLYGGFEKKYKLYKISDKIFRLKTRDGKVNKMKIK